ncbi:hypothetical protein BS47DRAFT_1364074 [Hydnum rufescens UP504]|uniref:Uncharacterized protein n=1 Tax=Hydnum rufescens UP504 TaxID=1448309 RepID=A0A9P6ATG4_9AGAM|nr:hypothetical protein BS47DRAFT_1364074 [Hydnum rufescens UP504]
MSLKLRSHTLNRQANNHTPAAADCGLIQGMKWDPPNNRHANGQTPNRHMCMVLCKVSDHLNQNPQSQTQPPNSNPPNKDPKQGVNHEPGMPQMNHTPTVVGHNWSEAPGVWFYLRSSPELPPMK